MRLVQKDCYFIFVGNLNIISKKKDLVTKKYFNRTMTIRTPSQVTESTVTVTVIAIIVTNMP